MTAYELGYQDYLDGYELIDNPYLETSYLFEVWEDGWLDAWYNDIMGWE